MTDYKNIRGKKIKFLTTDLSSEQSEGEIFYSDTDSQFKSVIASAVWSAGGNMVTARGLGGASGSQTAAFVAAGYTTTIVANTEEYNGTGFTTGGDVNTARSQTAGAGTLTAGLIAGGFAPPSVGNAEEYNGTAWSESGDLNIERRTMSGAAGTQTAALFFGGYRDITPTPNGAMNSTESYNGTSWTNESALNTAVWQNTGDGTQTAAVSVGGPSTQTEHYDGSSWTTNVAINTVRLAAGAAGTTSNILFYGGTTDGGDTGLSGATELYDGTSWTEVSDMAVARRGLGAGGDHNNAVAMGGLGPAKSNTEEFIRTVNTVTGSAWASGGNMNQSRYYMQGAGAAPQNAALGAGGYGPAAFESWGATEEYNGTSWSEVNDLPREMGRLFGLGTQTAALFGGGYAHPNTNYNEVFEYDGTNWSEGGDLNTARGMGINFGTQTAGLFGGGGNFGGSSSVEAEVEEYNGTSWTEVTNIPNATRNNASFGTQTAGVVTQGKISPSGGWPGTNTNVTFEYDGTNWTSAAAGLVTGPAGEGVGTQTDGGTCGNNGGIYQRYDGTSWITDARTASNGGSRGTSGTAAAAIAFAGFDDPTVMVATEEFTAETTSLNLKTITDS